MDEFKDVDMIAEEVVTADPEEDCHPEVVNSSMFDIVKIIVQMGEGEIRNILVKLFKRMSIEFLEELIEIIKSIKQS